MTEAENELVRLLLVDDQATVRQGLRMLLALEPDLAIVGEAVTGADACRLARKLAPDVVVMDVEMPVMDGIAATRCLRETMPEVGVVMLTIHSDSETRIRAKDAGAFALVEKKGAVEVLLARIREAARVWTNEALTG